MSECNCDKREPGVLLHFEDCSARRPSEDDVCKRCLCACDCCVDRVRGKLVPSAANEREAPEPLLADTTAKGSLPFPNNVKAKRCLRYGGPCTGGPDEPCGECSGKTAQVEQAANEREAPDSLLADTTAKGSLRSSGPTREEAIRLAGAWLDVHVPDAGQRAEDALAALLIGTVAQFTSEGGGK